MDILDVGYALKSYRQAKHLAQKEVAARLGISRVHYFQLERGKEHPSFTLLSKTVKLTRIPLDTASTRASYLEKDVRALCHSLTQRKGPEGVWRIVKRMIGR